ncbi:peptidase S9 family protein [Bacterioplanes sanyensis]|uniref:S9 family peptidase n=1 Tax=Bacterioplanes sanyensis TaxID=1249553 RepID=UPI001675DB61|nr:alpha/beta fold hydrolase [Bacterioplanes sanyensis]GGY46912.1 peptidase S9 family protein [Bacterioplanes sanyensis]
MVFRSMLATVMALCLTVPAQAVEQRSLNNGNLILEDIPPIPEDIINDLNRYQNVRSASFQGWSQDGNSLYITTRFGDVSQIHRVDKAGGSRHQLTFFDEPIGSVVMRPKHNQLAFTMDRGGNEFAQIFLLDLTSGEHWMISDGESRNDALLWNESGTRLAYQSTRRNGRSNDIWMAEFRGDDRQPKHTLVHAANDGSWWGPAAFSAGDDYLLMQQYTSSTQSAVHLKNLKTGKAQRLAGDDKQPSRNYTAGFNANYDGIYLLTDRFGEFTQLTHMSLSDGQESVITEDINWDISGGDMSSDRQTLAFSANVDGLTQVYLLDTASHQYRRLENLPMGLVGGLAFSPDDKRLAMSINTRQTATDVFVSDLQGDLKRWTYSEVGGLDTERFIEPELIRYDSFDGLQVPAFVYKPHGEGPFPVVISIHGGPESQYRPGFSSTLQMWLQKLGVAVIAPNVRGSSGYGKDYVAMDNGFKREDSVKDIGALLDWIATQPDLDQQRVAVIGGSYGGYMVLASAVHYSDRLKAAVNVVGISNFVTFLKNTQDYRRDLRRVEYGDERDPKMHDFLQRISPNNNVDKIKVPMFVVQGENDPRVPVTEAEQIVKALRESDNLVWYMNALNEGHGYRKKENRDVYSQAIVLFFQQHLLK